MKHSQSVEFLGQNSIGLDFIIEQLANESDLDSSLRDEISNNIKDIIGDQEIQWILRNGTKHLTDYVVYRYKFKYYPGLKKLEPFPLHLLLEPTSVCNLKCPMCFQSDSSFQSKEYLGMMDFDFFKDLVDQAVENNCKCLTLASRGEPTLHRQFGEMLNYCKNKFLELKINTNATKLSEELSYQILDSGVDIVVFSVDSFYKEEYEKIRVGASFERVFENIKRFCEMKKSKSQYDKTATRIYAVYIGEGQSKKKISNFWGNYVDTVAITDVVPRWDTYNNPPMNYNKPCNLLWERMYVWHDGICNPCDFDYKSKLRVGNAKERSLKEIWLGETFNKYREMLLQNKRQKMCPCDRCNVY
jgi:radical SAM protein with 4Fe4S-binding SPASM domain